MIRINLLEQKKAAGSSGPKFDLKGTGLLVGIWVAVLLVGFGWIGFKWYSLSSQIDQLKTDIVSADQELAELAKALQTVDDRQAKKEALEKRVVLISELKRRQSVPVHLLDQVSRNLPEFLWLEGLEEKDGAIQVRGKATTYNAVSNFYNNLQASEYFADVTLGTTQSVPEGVSFKLSCRFSSPGTAPADDEEEEDFAAEEPARS